VSAFCCALFGVPLGIAAIATGIIGLNQEGRGPGSQRGLAIAGIACGAGGLLLPLVFVLFFSLPGFTA
jgi:hypothetical protein